MDYSIEDLIRAVKLEADNRAKTAAYSGAMNDGGSGSLLNQVKFYEMGMNNIYPKEWEIYNRHIDPEYKEYLRLKGKFNK